MHTGCLLTTCAGDEAQGVIATLRILPEVDVAVVKDVSLDVDIVEALWGQDHAHIVTYTASSP